MSEINFYQNNPSLQALTLLPVFPKPANWIYSFGFASETAEPTDAVTYNNKFSIPNAINQFNFAYLTTYTKFLIGIAICLIIILLE
jgi:hypothetical protein